MSDLNNAINLIRQGQKGEAQKILEPLIKSDPRNIQAWFWYVETLGTVEKRIQILEMCLKLNPGNAQVSQALQKFRANQSSVSAQAMKPPVAPPRQVDELQEPYEDAQYSYDAFKPSSGQSNSNVYAEPYSYEPEPMYSDKKTSYEYDPFDPAPAKDSQKKPWELDPSEYVDNSMLSRSSKPKKKAQSYSTFDVWATVLTVQDVEAYEGILNDPRASLGRAFGWMAIAGLISALTFPILFFVTPQFSEISSMPEFQSMFASGDLTTFLIFLTCSMLVIAPISGIINLAISGGIQNLIAGFFAGSGDFTRTVYALAAYLAPVTILTSILVLIPFVGQCVASLLGFYSIVLNVRALRAAHSLTLGAAIGVLFAPFLLVVIFGCVIFLLVGGLSLPQQ